jgi:hypothetical protein
VKLTQHSTLDTRHSPPALCLCVESFPLNFLNDWNVLNDLNSVVRSLPCLLRRNTALVTPLPLGDLRVG